LTCLLDTSALLMHFMKEPGADKVQALIDDEGNEIHVSAVSIAEMACRMSIIGCDTAEARATSLAYASLADRVIVVDVAVATRAFEISSTSSERIPLVDALTAACASVGNATLVHRDAHFRSIPDSLLQRLDL
jgi:predicted nucleic acid-binding protein